MTKCVRRSIRQAIFFPLILILVVGWVFSGWPQIWQNPPIPLQPAIVYAGDQTFTATDSSWPVPVGVTSLTVKMWGGGAGGSPGGSRRTGGGGGGGAAYTECTVVVTPETNYVVTVGAAVSSGNGNASSFVGNDGTCTANAGVTTTSDSGGAGGVAQSVGGVVTAAFAGGAGGAGETSSGGGGGGGGEGSGIGSNGNNGTAASGSTGGAGGTGDANGGDGGRGADNQGVNLGNSAAPGGGGGGAGGSSNTVGAGERGEVTLEWSATVISITVVDGVVAYGIVASGNTQDTTATGINNTQNGMNTGNVAEDFEIRGNDSASWSLITTDPPGTNQYTHEYSSDGGTTWVFMENQAGVYRGLATSVAADTTQTFDLRIKPPSSTTDFAPQSVDVSVQATESP